MPDTDAPQALNTIPEWPTLAPYTIPEWPPPPRDCRSPNGRIWSDAPTAARKKCIVYDRETIDTLDPEAIGNLTPPQLAYVSAMIKDGVHHYISNVPDDVEYALICYKGCALPFTVSRKQETVFPVSPKTCWIDYARLLYRKSDGRAPAPFSNFLLGAIGKVARFERLITLNNWWLTNNPTPRFSREHIRVFVDYFTSAYPDYMIVVKSLPETDPTKVLPILRDEGFDFVKFRFMHFRVPEAKRTKNFRADQNLLKKMPLQTYYASRITASQAAECERLYQSLYIGKHTEMNTQLNRNWMELCCNTGFLDFFMIENGGSTKGLVVSYGDPIGINVGTCGYDLGEPKKTGLYRILVASTLLKGEAEGKTVNLSTSVPRFKELRGTHRVIEYEAVYTKHLSPLTCGLMKAFAWGYNNCLDKMRCA